MMHNPSVRFPAPLVQLARGNGQAIRLAIFDVDGVLTDGRIYIGPHGETEKAFNTLDGHGMKLLQLAGIEPVVITGRDSPAVRRRLQDLGIRHGRFGIHDKLQAANLLMAELGVDWGAVAAIGDDWPDLPLLTRAAFSVAPFNAHHDIKGLVHFVTSLAGGYGAAREFCDLLLTATGKYTAFLEQYSQSLDVTTKA